MGITLDLLELFTDTATWFPLQSRDEYAKPNYLSTGNIYPVRRIKKTRLIRKGENQQIASTQQIWIGPSLTSGEPFPDVKVVDKIVLSDGTSPQIADTQVYQDELSGTEGPAYCEVFFL